MRLPFRLSVLCLGVWLLWGGAWGAEPGERAHVTVLVTTDLHSHLAPIDYYTDRPAENGLAKIATLVAQARQRDAHLLLIDCGDTIQGTPLAAYHSRYHNTPPDPMMLAMNALGYDAMTLGNHEFNFGLPVLEKARQEARFPWLSANTYRVGTDTPAFTPYLVKAVQGVRIGILGLTTPGIPSWEDPSHFAGFEFRETVAEAAKWVRILREQEHVDAVVAAVHFGLEEDPDSGQRGLGAIAHENAALALARQVPGIDLLVLGHTHRAIPALVVNGVLLAQAGRWGDNLVQADLYFARTAAGGWTLAAKASRLLPVRADTPADPSILALGQPYHVETQAWLNRTIGTCRRELTTTGAFVQDTALLDLVQRVQLETGAADVSLAANFNPRAHIAAGPVTVRDIAGLYVYENTLVVIEVTGAQLRAALEHAARFFLPYQPGKTAEELIDRTVPGYSFDLAEGVEYEIDLTRPPGDRIRQLTFQGAPLAPERKLRLALNNYRYNGGGGYTMFQDAPVVYRSSEEIRELIVDWVERHHEIPAEPTHNWRIVPPALTPAQP